MQKKLPPCSSLSDLLSCSNILIVQSKTNPTSIAEQPKIDDRERGFTQTAAHLSSHEFVKFLVGQQPFFRLGWDGDPVTVFEQDSRTTRWEHQKM